ncbi:SDR family oxidoreductase [Flavobacterium sp. J27]|uniref:SDR family oxidoreductase n=1 Tax=Flavobacterium sp. J27 TaxID=2060419 RepID=UPI00103225DE|nr:SDR family oxidoreductase [Flavobacterium sp. J27]
MRILLTGANGYVGRRLLPELIAQGHEIVCCVRDKNRLGFSLHDATNISVWEVDFLTKPTFENIPKNIDAAYYLIHSMSSSTTAFDAMESKTATHFNEYMLQIQPKHVIYLSGIVNHSQLSKHLKSRKNVETILYQGNSPVTVLRAGIIVGSGSSSFEIIRDLCEKLPLMITPKWVLTKTQPIAIRNVIQYLIGVLFQEKCYNQSYDIAGPDILSYKEMLQQYAKARGFKNWILTVPVITPKLSSYWLYFVTSTSYKLAMNLVDSMKIEVIARKNNLQELLQITPITYEEAISLAFLKIEQNLVISSWKDSLISGRFCRNLSELIQVPTYGCLTDHQTMPIQNIEKTLDNIWSIGGNRGWYYGNWMWKVRGFLDKMVGGVGLRRGRTHPTHLDNGDVLDFWRVVLADRNKKRLLLFAEMRLPGEAWLEFRIDEQNNLHQIATFRPKGWFGRLYWYTLIPFHYFIFGGMIRNVTKTE